jgi:PAS domain S-box-containing protein
MFKKKQEAEQEAEEDAIAHLAAIVESSEDAIVSKDLNGIIKTWNHGAEMLFGYRESEVVGKSITFIIPSRLRSEEDEILSKIRSGQRISHFETIRQNKEGKEINVSITVSPVKDKGGKVIGASKIARDISQQKLLERELQKMNEHKEG